MAEGTVMGLRRAILYVKNIDRMAAFYTDVMRLRAIEATRTDTWVEFEGGFALHAVAGALAERIEISSPPGVRDTSPVKLSFGVERARLDALGVVLLERAWGGCDGVDPEGNVFGIEEPN